MATLLFNLARIRVVAFRLYNPNGDLSVASVAGLHRLLGRRTYPLPAAGIFAWPADRRRRGPEPAVLYHMSAQFRVLGFRRLGRFALAARRPALPLLRLVVFFPRVRPQAKRVFLEPFPPNPPNESRQPRVLAIFYMDSTPLGALGGNQRNQALGWPVLLRFLWNNSCFGRDILCPLLPAFIV